MATDGDANTYWESANNAFPQWLQVDLGATYSIGKVTLKLPPSSAWGTRTQTLSVQTSTDGSTSARRSPPATLHLHLADQRREHHRSGDQRPLRPGQHHRQHAAGRPARSRSSRSTRAAAPRPTRRR